MGRVMEKNPHCCNETDKIQGLQSWSSQVRATNENLDVYNVDASMPILEVVNVRWPNEFECLLHGVWMQFLNMLGLDCPCPCY